MRFLGRGCLDFPVSVASLSWIGCGGSWPYGIWEWLQPGTQVGCSGFLGSREGRGTAAGGVAGLGRADTARATVPSGAVCGPCATWPRFWTKPEWSSGWGCVPPLRSGRDGVPSLPRRARRRDGAAAASTPYFAAAFSCGPSSRGRWRGRCHQVDDLCGLRRLTLDWLGWFLASPFAAINFAVALASGPGARHGRAKARHTRCATGGLLLVEVLAATTRHATVTVTGWRPPSSPPSSRAAPP